MRVEYVSRYAAASDLTELASLAMNASLPAGFSPEESGAVSIEPESNPVVGQDGSAKWKMRTERKIRQQIDPALVAKLVQGDAAWDVKARLSENLPLAAEPDVQLNPSWWPWLPIVPFRISVVTE